MTAIDGYPEHEASSRNKPCRPVWPHAKSDSGSKFGGQGFDVFIV